MNLRYGLRNLIGHLGYDFYSVSVLPLTFRDLEFDLPLLLKCKHPIVVDVGANEGQTIDLVRRAFDAPIIYSSEPNPESASALNEKYGRSEVVVESIALGSSEGSVVFNLSENSELSSVLALDQTKENPFSKVGINAVLTVPVTTLDSYVRQRGLLQIDLLKIDTQGFDLEVLHGALDLLDRLAVNTILIEVNFIKIYREQCSFGDIQIFLREKGYGLVALYEVARINLQIGWATACFQRAIS